MSIEIPDTQPEQIDSPKSTKARAIYAGRCAVGAIVGVGAVVGGALAGHAFAGEAIAHSSPMAEIYDQVAAYGGAILGGVLGAMVGVEVAAEIAGDKPTNANS